MIFIPLSSYANKLDSLVSLYKAPIKLEETISLSKEISKYCLEDESCYQNIYSQLGKEAQAKILYLEYQLAYHISTDGHYLQSIAMNKSNAKKAKKLGLMNLSSDLNLNTANSFLELLKPDSALYYLIEANKSLDKAQEDYRRWLILFNLSQVYHLINDRSNEEKNLLLAYDKVKEKNIRMDIGYVLYHILQYYKGHGPDEKLNYYLDIYLEFLNERSHDSKHQAILNLFVDEEEAILKMEAYLHSKEGKEYKKHGRCYMSAELGFLYFKQKKYNKAKFKLEHVTEQCEDYNTSQLISITEILIEIYKLESDHPKTILAYERLINYKDSLNQEKQLEAIYGYKEKYESEKKDKLIVKQKLSAQKNKVKLWFLGVGILLLSLFGASFYVLNQKKRKRERIIQAQRLKELELQNDLIAFEAMMLGEEKERTRLSRELHDGIGALLTNIKARFQLFQENSVSQEQLDETSRIIERTYAEVRRVSQNLMPNSLQLLGLKGAIEDLAAENTSQQLSFETIIEGLSDDLDENKELIIYRIIQELVTNAIKHAKSNQILIQLIKHDELLSISVEDNGQGFNVEDKNKAKCLGLENIRSRVNYLKGEFDIDSKIGVGTSFTIVFPVENLQKNDQSIYHR